MPGVIFCCLTDWNFEGFNLTDFMQTFRIKIEIVGTICHRHKKERQ